MLTQSQIDSYHRDGYLLASGLIPDSLSAAAEARMWDLMEMDAQDSATWSRLPDGAHEFSESRGVVIFNALQDEDLMACATPAYLAAVSQLIGESVEQHPPQAVHTQNLLQQHTEPSTLHIAPSTQHFAPSTWHPLLGSGRGPSWGLLGAFDIFCIVMLSLAMEFAREVMPEMAFGSSAKSVAKALKDRLCDWLNPAPLPYR